MEGAPGGGGGSQQSSQTEVEVSELERGLPIANVARIMKKALPPNSKITKEAKEFVEECATEFISFITSEASERGQIEKRKTLTGDDVLNSLNTLGFGDFVEPLREHLMKYKENDFKEENKGSNSRG
nr:nuclear transcription factor Y subunit B-10 [Ipomoea batatas]